MMRTDCWPRCFDMYNRHVLLRVLLLAALLSACGKNIETKEAVRAAVLDSVQKKGVNLGQMEVEVTSVSFKGKEADATVDFRAKGAAPGTGITMKYTLEKNGSAWAVRTRGQAQGTNPHDLTTPPAGGQLPSGHPPVTK